MKGEDDLRKNSEERQHLKNWEGERSSRVARGWEKCGNGEDMETWG